VITSWWYLHADCVFSVYIPNKDVGSVNVVHKEVDVTRDPRLGFSHSESMYSPDNDLVSGGFFEADSQHQTLSHQTLSDTKSDRGQLRSRRKFAKSRGKDEPAKHQDADAAELSGSNVAFGSMNGQGSIDTITEVRPLRLRNGTSMRPDVLTGSSVQQSGRKGKEDLNEILRKRLEKLEEKLTVISSEHSVPAAADESAKGMRMGDDRRTISVNSRAEKKRKSHADAGDGNSVKRFRNSDDEQARIIAANVGMSETNTSDAKLDKYLSYTLNKAVNPDEGLLSLTADFSDELTSLVESNCWQQSQNNQFGKSFLSSAEEQLVDTETIMINVLSQNLLDADACSSHPQDANNTSEIPDVCNATSI